MKTILQATALATLMMGAGVTTVQADEVAVFTLINEGPLLMLAEGGSDRLTAARLQREAVASNDSKQGASQRFIQMIEQQPTAAGIPLERKDQPVEKSQLKGIRGDRALYGSPH